jgi:CRP-like cAMP-binding protein/nucleotide-binding universal stress UspA family protein
METNTRKVSIVMDPRALVVLIDGEPGDAALVGKAREYADERDCPVTLVRVLPEVTRARNDNGVVILPWQVMQLMESNAKAELEQLRTRYLRGRAHSNTKLVRFGRVADELANVVQVERAHAVLARSKNSSLLPWLKRDARLQRKIDVPVLFLDATDQVVGLVGSEPLSSNEKVRAISQLRVFAGMSRKALESVARNFDEARVDGGTTVIHEGRSNHALWIVVEGELALTKRGKMLERVSPPGLVGVPSMLDGRPAWATVTAITPVRALVASTEQFRALCADDRIAERLWAQTGARLRNYMLESMKVAG